MSEMQSENLDFNETLRLRQTHLSGACQLHFADNPIKIVKASGQYLISDRNEKLLDFGTRVSVVGHCHPDVYNAGAKQMSKFNCYEEPSDIQQKYAQRLLNSFPPSFDVCLFTSSGSEANDIAIQLAKNYTSKTGILVMENALHGSTSAVTDISQKAFRKLITGKKAHVHVIPLPDMYRGQYAQESNATDKYFHDAKILIDRILQQNELGISCFISEPVMVTQGMIVPPPGWLKKIYSYVREVGGITIADENQIGFGRCGKHLWYFQSQNVLPDVVTIGKPIANGYPLAAVITSKKILHSSPKFQKKFYCEPVAAAIGNAVLDIIYKEKLMDKVLSLSDYFYTKLMNVKNNSRIIGDVRYLGFLFGVDIVWSRESRKPAPSLAEQLSLKMKDKRIIVANEGEYNNVLNFIPPLCITEKDIDYLIDTFQNIIKEVEFENSDEVLDTLNSATPSNSTYTNNIAFPSTSFASTSGENSSVSGFYANDSSNDETDYDAMD